MIEPEPFQLVRRQGDDEDGRRGADHGQTLLLERSGALLRESVPLDVKGRLFEQPREQEESPLGLSLLE